jgi:hypothetical protein
VIEAFDRKIIAARDKPSPCSAASRNAKSEALPMLEARATYFSIVAAERRIDLAGRATAKA